MLDLSLPDLPITHSREIYDEIKINISFEDLNASMRFHLEQQHAYSIILDRVSSGLGEVFFIDGLGWTRKTYLYRALLVMIRSRRMIAIATKISSVASSFIPGGQTSHSRLKIPINLNESSLCNITKQNGTTELLRKASIIVWDEAPMAFFWVIKVVDRNLRDIMDNQLVFGGKIIVFGRDFKQVLPVVPHATRVETMNASLVMSYLWPKMEKLRLTRNMRAQLDTTFSDFLLRVGDGDENSTNEDMINIPDHMLVQYKHGDDPEKCMINTIFPSLREHANSSKYIKERAILTTKNEFVDIMNEKLIAMFLGEFKAYYSFD